MTKQFDNPDQIDLFDTTDPDLIPPPGVEVLSKELSDKWQAEFYSTPIDRTPNAQKAVQKLHPMIEAKKKHEAKAMSYPAFINNKVLTSYIGSMVLAEIVDIRKNHKTNAIEVVYSVVNADGVEMYACDPIGLPNVPEVYTVEKMRTYLQLYPTKGHPVKQMQRDVKSSQSLVAFYAAIRARMFRAQMANRPTMALIEPCMSVRGNVYLKIHNPACSQ